MRKVGLLLASTLLVTGCASAGQVVPAPPPPPDHSSSESYDAFTIPDAPDDGFSGLSQDKEDELVTAHEADRDSPESNGNDSHDDSPLPQTGDKEGSDGKGSSSGSSDSGSTHGGDRGEDKRGSNNENDSTGNNDSSTGEKESSGDGDKKRKNSSPKGLTGFFIFGQNNSQENYDMLEDIKAHGGDTVITFGYTLDRSSRGELASGLFSSCQVGSTSCVNAVKQGVNVRNYLLYKGNTPFSSDARLCSRDVFTTAGSRSYAFFAVPVDGSCSTARQFDIIGTTSTGFSKEGDVTQQAHKLGMKHYHGLPAPAKDKKQAWLPDVSYLSTMKDFTQRFVKAHSTKGLGGYYQHREMPMSTNSSWDSMLSLYKTQNDAVSRSSSVKRVLLSPYIDARKHMSQDPAQAGQAVKKMAGTKGNLSQLIIAPQDGMGTGKGTAYSGEKWGWKVDPYQVSVVGGKTNAQAYLGSSKDYYSHMKSGLKGVRGVSLWANIENMAPLITKGSHSNVCSTAHHAERGHTLKSRLETQVDAAKNHTEKLVSYHWNYLNCDSPRLKDILPEIR